jgi:Zn-dependent protease/CBS domain-containing protein
MKLSVKIGSVGGIPIELHVTFILLMAFVFYISYLASQYYLFFLLIFLFAFVTIHELSHSVVARHYKVTVRKIVLYPIGGVSEIQEIPDNPRIEWRLAIAGPLMSLLIGGVLYVLYRYLSIELPADLFPPAYTITGSAMYDLALLNVVLGLFNLLPAFPMDGGRVLRAILAERMNFSTATSIAASIGRTFGLLLTFYGFLFGGLYIGVIGLFIYFGANQEAASAIVSTALASVKVDDVMSEEISSATLETTLSEALDIMFKARYHDILVEEDHSLRGVVTWSDIMKIKPQQRPTLKLREMRIKQISAFRNEPVLEAYKVMAREKIDLIPVVERESPDKVVGVLTSEGVARAYEKAKELS